MCGNSLPLCDNRDWTIAHVNDRRPSHAGQAKDAEFSRATVNARWAGGLEDIRRSAANLEWMQPLDLGPGIQVYFLPPVGLGGSTESGSATISLAELPEAEGSEPPNDKRPRRSA